MAQVKGQVAGTSGINPEEQAAVLGDSASDAGVIGLSAETSGVRGVSLLDVGITGEGLIAGVHAFGKQRGILAENGQTIANGAVAAIEATSTAALGVYANSVTGVAAYAYSEESQALYATSGTGHAVHGAAQQKGTGVIGESAAGLAGAFFGPVSVTGAFTVFGAKSAAVCIRDGSHRLMYSLECPESWFEDFGESKLVAGRARISIDPTFRSCVKLKRYHVFLTPAGDCDNLYVSKKTARSFEVHESSGGKSSVTFSYRIVAKRADQDLPRLARVQKPRAPVAPSKPKPFTRRAPKSSRRKARDKR